MKIKYQPPAPSDPLHKVGKRKPAFADFLCSCPAEECDLALSRDPDNGSNREEAFAYHEKLLQARQDWEDGRRNFHYHDLVDAGNRDDRQCVDIDT